MKPPKVTLAFLSWNRLHYLRATLESARECIRYPDLEWIVSDNGSEEPGLRDYIESCGWISNKWYRVQTHAEAMNEIVARASGDYILLWPEDVQFVVRGDWLAGIVSAMEANPWIGSTGLNFLRRKTYRRLLAPPGPGDAVAVLAELRRRGWNFRSPKTLPGGLRTAGWRLPGVVCSGIPSLTRRSCWEKLGPWKTKSGGGDNIVDSSLGAEDDMIERFQNSGFHWQQAMLMKPVAADIINDDTGCKAKVRGGVRYGIYTPPAEGPFYYEIRDEEDLPDDEEGYPLNFENHVRPVGFLLPLDSGGNLLKASFNDSVSHRIAPTT